MTDEEANELALECGGDYEILRFGKRDKAQAEELLSFLGDVLERHDVEEDGCVLMASVEPVPRENKFRVHYRKDLAEHPIVFDHLVELNRRYVQQSLASLEQGSEEYRDWTVEYPQLRNVA